MSEWRLARHLQTVTTSRGWKAAEPESTLTTGADTGTGSSRTSFPHRYSRPWTALRVESWDCWRIHTRRGLGSPRLGRRSCTVGQDSQLTGLICKAADAGYKVIIVIAGIHNNLRNQTQIRIDEGFVGRDSARLLSNKEKRSVGVGLFDSKRIPVTFTNSKRDFNKQTATSVGIPLQNLTEPAVFVIKKNSSTLRNLLEWLQEHSGKGGGRESQPAVAPDRRRSRQCVDQREAWPSRSIKDQRPNSPTVEVSLIEAVT